MDMDIGKRIKQRREELGLTQEELAKKLGYANRSSVNKVETSREVSMKMINSYAIALETTVPYLMGWEEEDKKIEEQADDDFKNMLKDERLVNYAIKLSNLSKEKQEHIISLIDMLEEKGE